MYIGDVINTYIRHILCLMLVKLTPLSDSESLICYYNSCFFLVTFKEYTIRALSGVSDIRRQVPNSIKIEHAMMNSQ